jgi:hypothetical protein
MRKRTLLAVLPLLLLLVNCELVSPDQVQGKFESALRQYFVNAKVIVYPADHAIIGLTCMQDAGPKLITTVREQFVNLPDLQNLKYLRTLGPLLGSSNYKFVALGFSREIVRLDIDSWTIQQYSGGNEYAAEYKQVCGIGDSAAESQAYFGLFRVTLRTPYKGFTEITSWDSLGVWDNDQDFSAAKDREVQGRTRLILEELESRGMVVKSVDLVRIDHSPFPSRLTSEVTVR